VVSTVADSAKLVLVWSELQILLAVGRSQCCGSWLMVVVGESEAEITQGGVYSARELVVLVCQLSEFLFQHCS